MTEKEKKAYEEGFKKGMHLAEIICHRLLEIYYKGVDREKVTPKKMLERFPEFVCDILPILMKHQQIIYP